MSASYPHVFSPFKIGTVEVRNRFYFGPHGTPLSAGHHPSGAFAHYYAERAAGAVGLTLMSLPVLHRNVGRMCPTVDATIPSFAVLAEMIHEHGAKVFGQLHYSWVTPNWQWEPLSPLAPTMGPTPQQRFDNYGVTRAMSKADIRALLERFRHAARNLRQAGFDGFEIHVTHGMLGEQFLSPYFNQRSDEYGGSLENRVRLPAEMLEAVREGGGPDAAVGMRFICDEMVPGGIDQDGSRAALSRLVERELLDFVDLDIAIEPNQFPLGMPSYFIDKLPYESFVASVRPAAGDRVAVLSALGRVTKVADAERVIAAGTVDMVGAVRGLIAEPELVKNALEGHEERSRTCLACNACMGQPAVFFGCVINPATAREARWGARTLTSAPLRRRVVVVGGGPAGLEAARVAALRGHSVTLLEQHDGLGGQLNLWALLPGREIMSSPAGWYQGRLRELGVEVRMGSRATAASIMAERPDAVILATGSRYDRSGSSGFMAGAIPGADQPFVFAPEQILEDGVRPAGKVLVLDDEGLNTGAGIAELLAAGGVEVELVTRWLQVVPNLFKTLEWAFIIPRLHSRQVVATTQTYLKEIGDHRATLFNVFTNEEEVRTGLDAVVLVTRRLQQTGLELELKGKVEQLFPVGDALAARGLAEATFEGHRFARAIGEEGAPRNFTEALWEPIPAESYQRPAAELRDSAAR